MIDFRKDISEFNIGDEIESISGIYKVIDIKFKVNSKRKRYDEYSIIEDIHTHRVFNVTWYKNKNFILKKEHNERTTSPTNNRTM